MSTQDDLKSRFLRFRENKYAIYIGLALTFIVCSLLLVYSSYLLCFGLLLVALAGYYIPYYFGMRSRKKLAVWGIILILLLAFPYAFSLVEGQKASANNPLSSNDGTLINGTVDPFNGDANTVHTFTVLVTNASYSDVRVVIFDALTGTLVSNNTMTGSEATGGTLFTFSGTLQNRTAYYYYFTANSGDGWITTKTANYGPFHLSDAELYAQLLPRLILALFLEVGLLYFLLLILSWWTDKSKARLAEAQKKRGTSLPAPGKEGTEEKFICSECGAEVPSSASKCPQCGEKFDESKDEPAAPVKKKDEFVCTECGATVDEKAKTCWNCGKEFED